MSPQGNISECNRFTYIGNGEKPDGTTTLIISDVSPFCFNGR
jgi:hypothetical protein